MNRSIYVFATRRAYASATTDKESCYSRSGLHRPAPWVDSEREDDIGGEQAAHLYL